MSAPPPISTPSYLLTPNHTFCAIASEQLESGMNKPPLVSCLMVSRGDVSILQYALQCYLDQDYPNRELILVTSHPSTGLERLIARYPAAQIKLIPASPGLSIGELRNISLAHAGGSLVCTWDDDDLSDPQRLSVSVRVLLAGNAPAFFLMRCLIWWPARRLFALSTWRAWENTMVAVREVMPSYPPVSRLEDTFVMDAIRQDRSVAVIEVPYLYCYTVTGNNTCGEEHFKDHLDLAHTVIQGDGYEKGLARLAKRMPIREYAAELERRSFFARETKTACAELDA